MWTDTIVQTIQKKRSTPKILLQYIKFQHQGKKKKKKDREKKKGWASPRCPIKYSKTTKTTNSVFSANRKSHTTKQTGK